MVSRNGRSSIPRSLAGGSYAAAAAVPYLALALAAMALVALRGTSSVVDAFSPPQSVALGTQTTAATATQQQQQRIRHRRPRRCRGFDPISIATTPMTTTTTTTANKNTNNHQRQRSAVVLEAAIPFFATTETERNDRAAKSSSPAFLIEPITAVPSARRRGDGIYRAIADLCINVFFRELIDPSGEGGVNLLKAWQIRYLKNLQSADLERRRDRQPDTNEMFLAYEVRKPSGPEEVLTQPLLMDEELEKVHNLPKRADDGNNNSSGSSNDDDDDGYVRGKMLGFVEVTQRSYGLGGSETPGPLDLALASVGSGSSNNRPVLTNLAVLRDSRGCGIGSKLLEACEDHVLSEWMMNEIVLEVEDYNDSGLEFYKRKGYTVLFSDPASRRFDIEGFWLNKVRCRRDIMRKTLVGKPSNCIRILRRIRNTVNL